MRARTHAHTHIFFLSKERENKLKMVEGNVAKNNIACRFVGES